MSGNTLGKLFCVTSFGESHGPAIGCVVDGCPPGLELSEADIQKFRRYAIPMWFNWAKRDPLAKEAFSSQLAFMKTFNVGYITDSMLVDIDGKTKLTL